MDALETLEWISNEIDLLVDIDEEENDVEFASTGVSEVFDHRELNVANERHFVRDTSDPIDRCERNRDNVVVCPTSVVDSHRHRTKLCRNDDGRGAGTRGRTQGLLMRAIIKGNAVVLMRRNRFRMSKGFCMCLSLSIC